MQNRWYRLFTRPRRFGKTLNMDMLRVFLRKRQRTLRFILKINRYGSMAIFIHRHQGQYPVVFLTFKDVKCLTWEETFQKIRILISLEFIRHNELENSSVLTTV
ncbi:MAG: AAA family ATPase [Gemmiger formicilis]|uniref:AAA family ATPase n=1 Tax=Gemmiger formicilis TaxID=745368 RepID=UPI00399209E6